jgi:hypothetical protein
MKKLLNALSAIIIALPLLMTGSPVFAVVGCEQSSVTIVSDTTNMAVGDGNAMAVVAHPAWTAVIPGSTTWIWKTSATGPNEVVAFEKGFTVTGSTVLSAVLDIATDNSYEVFIDGSPVVSDASATNFTLATQDTHNIVADVTPGAHTLRIEVKNIGSYDADVNPAGLLYKLVVDSETCGGGNSDNGNTSVSNHNYAKVKNYVSTGSNTGGNSSNGGNGGNAGNGGSVNNSDDDNTGGNAGNGGTGGNGGLVVSGDADAETLILNDVNYNDTRIKRGSCGCDGDSMINGNDRVRNYNGGKVGNHVATGADTGNNNTDGGNGGKAGNAGGVNNSNDDNTGGNSGTGGNGGHAGGVLTGTAAAYAGIGTSVNTNITRIRR